LTPGKISANPLIMTDATEIDDESDQDQELGPSLALPPLYVLRTAAYCPECYQAQHVYMLGCVAFHDAEDRHQVDEFHFLRRIESLPQPILALLKTKLTSYYLDRTEEKEPLYLMNHCQCGAKLDDDFVCGDVGAAFWPDTPEGYGDFRLLRLSVEGPIPIRCSCGIGGGEYLNFAKTWAW
jgi:hypothetical protein